MQEGGEGLLQCRAARIVRWIQQQEEKMLLLQTFSSSLGWSDYFQHRCCWSAAGTHYIDIQPSGTNKPLCANKKRRKISTINISTSFSSRVFVSASSRGLRTLLPVSLCRVQMRGTQKTVAGHVDSNPMDWNSYTMCKKGWKEIWNRSGMYPSSSVHFFSLSGHKTKIYKKKPVSQKLFYRKQQQIYKHGCAEMFL